MRYDIVVVQVKQFYILVSIDRLDSAHFASQQRGDPDFTEAEKTRMAEALLAKSPAAFLARFGKSLAQSHLAFFEQHLANGDQEVQLNKALICLVRNEM